MTEVAHGGLQDGELAALGLEREDVVDLSANLHPAGPDPRVLEAARRAVLDRYPPPDAAPLRDAIAAHHDLDPAMVLVTPGATAAIHLVARALSAPGVAAAVFPPTFGEYEAALHLVGASIRLYPGATSRFETAIENVESGSLAFLCQPNNPTGVLTSPEDLFCLVERLKGGTLVLDLAYEPFLAPDEVPVDVHALIREGAPIVALHSMTKLHAIPGLRLGYVVAAPATIARLAAMQPAWSVDAPSIAAGIEAIAQTEERRALLAPMVRARHDMRAAFHALGCQTAPGRANFLLAEVGDGAAVRAALLRRGLAVRDCASFGLPEWIRVAVPAPAIARRFIDALPSALAEARPAFEEARA